MIKNFKKNIGRSRERFASNLDKLSYKYIDLYHSKFEYHLISRLVEYVNGTKVKLSGITFECLVILHISSENLVKSDLLIENYSYLNKKEKQVRPNNRRAFC